MTLTRILKTLCLAGFAIHLATANGNAAANPGKAQGDSKPGAARPDILIADFEGADYGAWKVEGDAFGKAPTGGVLPNQQPVSGFKGKGLVNTYAGGDSTTGTLTSPAFPLERKYLNFLIGGGSHENEACMNLLIDGKVVRTATGRNDEQLGWESWDVSAFAGRNATLQIVDHATGNWGHINIDQIVQSDVRTAPQIVKGKLYDETYRPQFHFTAEKNWLNDPNGLVFYNGKYHLFFQHNPTGINWGNMTWGHAVSTDLFHWEQLPHAIPPDKLGTIFSGSAVVDPENTTGFGTANAKPLVCIYTAAGGTSEDSKGQPFTQCIAYSTDGRTFTKYDKNPVLGHIVGGNRDPKVIWFAPAKKWVMALYLDGDAYALFESADLKSWTKLHDLSFPGHGECPDFFPMAVDGNAKNQKWVFTAANGAYLLGSFDGKTFKPDGDSFRADIGANYYAVQTYSDIPARDGRRIQISWMNGGQYPQMPFNQQMSAPCELTLRTCTEGIRLYRYPVKEIKGLHTKTHTWRRKPLQPGENLLSGLSGDLFDIEAEIKLGSAKEVGFTLRGGAVTYDVASKKLNALGRSATLDPIEGKIRLRILLDRASLEVFGNDGKVSATSCFLPLPDNRKLEIFAKGGSAEAVSLVAHELRSAWPRSPAR